MLSRKDNKNCDCCFGDSEIVLHEEWRYLKEGSQDTVALAYMSWSFLQQGWELDKYFQG